MAMSQSMEDRNGFIWLDGELLPWRQATPHVLSHALHYGSAVFEGERIYDGRIFRLAAHSARLLKSARLLEFEVPWSRTEIDEATRAVVRANGLSQGYVRPLAWRGAESIGVSAIGTKVHLAIAPWDWGAYFSAEAAQRGVRLAMAQFRRPSPENAPGESKASGLYIICTMEKDRALRAGYDDALMLDWKGRIAEATSANVFLMIDGTLVTPKVDNFLDGITRREVLALARSLAIPTLEREVWPQDLERASELFLTGTAAELVPVCEVAGRNFQIGRTTRHLIQGFAQWTRTGDVEGFGACLELADPVEAAA